MEGLPAGSTGPSRSLQAQAALSLQPNEKVAVSSTAACSCNADPVLDKIFWIRQKIMQILISHQLCISGF